MPSSSVVLVSLGLAARTLLNASAACAKWPCLSTARPRFNDTSGWCGFKDRAERYSLTARSSCPCCASETPSRLCTEASPGWERSRSRNSGSAFVSASALQQRCRCLDVVSLCNDLLCGEPKDCESRGQNTGALLKVGGKCAGHVTLRETLLLNNPERTEALQLDAC